MEETSWFVAYTYPRAEKKVHERIIRFGSTSFLPLIQQERIWSDRVKRIEVPLFSNYVFVQTREQNLPILARIHGIARFVKFRDRYARIKDKEIGLIRKLLDKGHNLQIQATSFSRGQQVKVIEGPFYGLQGKLIREGGKNRFIIEFEGLEHALSVNISTNCLAPL